ncbi:cupin domain-containing protein [Owenweeksia hongkongensis DSM 17368]|uniref:Cupin domain-containing protein n=1 Tax=Owenweeksia hongkongensis (strain DSM 17368 / CIP 108786 / JCM 12287 / NRRL B-23963 / UST20020801) TaxID=926562 RepID=G8R5T5_OWEHD|nr:cupin domain-containing protein [Owenweeksia hongkongensis]AEV34401.1 cupin domain-containing protein [Owenweeksia hongkongensis DSM 17368]
MMLKELHSSASKVSAFPLFRGTGMIAAIQIPAREQLKEHVTKMEAILLCVEGEALYETETEERVYLVPGKYVNILPNVKHWVNSIKDSQLILMK